MFLIYPIILVNIKSIQLYNKKESKEDNHSSDIKITILCTVYVISKRIRCKRNFKCPKNSEFYMDLLYRTSFFA